MASQSGKKSAAERKAQLEKLRAEQKRKERRQRIYFGVGAGALVLVLVGLIIGLVVMKNNNSNSSMASSQGAVNAPALADPWSGLTGQTVDGVSANTNEQLAYHIHAHLAIYIDGKQYAVPAGIGITKPWTSQTESDGSTFIDGGGAFYYLHTHDASGVVHMESPTQTTYTLGQFFAEWNQTLSATQIGSHTGSVTAFVNGSAYKGNPADIPMNAHDVIQLDLGQVVGFQPYVFASGL